MRTFLTVLSLVVISTASADIAEQEVVYLSEDEAVPLFQRCVKSFYGDDLASQAVHLRGKGREKRFSPDEMVILNLEFPSAMQTEDIAERIAYGDADVVHLKNTSTAAAFCLCELLWQRYAHFIHVPSQENGMFIASKYPLKYPEVTQVVQDNVFCRKMLNFSILEDDICARIGSNELSIQIINSKNEDDQTIIPVLLVDVPGTFSVVKRDQREFASFRLSERGDLQDPSTLQIIPVKRGGGENDSREGGAYGGGRVTVEFGPNGSEWSASAFGGYEDNRGNYVEVEVKRDEGGTTSASAEAGYESNKKD